LTRKTSLWGPVILCMGIIFYVSALPEVSIPTNISDKSGHSLAYALLSALLLRAFAGGLRVPARAKMVVTAMALATAYGGALELYQLFVPGRTADVQDLIADAIGAAVGAVALWLCGILLPAPRDLEGPSRHGL